MRDWLNKLFDTSNISVDIVSVAIAVYAFLSLMSIFILIFLEIYSVVVLNHEFKPTEYGTGLGAIFGGSGLAALFHTMKRFNNEKSE